MRQFSTSTSSSSGDKSSGKSSSGSKFSFGRTWASVMVGLGLFYFEKCYRIDESSDDMRNEDLARSFLHW